MYNFPNFDNDTRFIMISELVRDIENGLFYEPSSLKSSYIARYKELLRKCFEYGTVEGLERALVSSLFKDKDKSGRKTPSNIATLLAFSDFNRYYMRAILVRAIDENKSVCVYRAKQSLHERQESKIAVGQCYFDKIVLVQMLKILRNYKMLFTLKNKPSFMQINSGLSLKLV